MREEGGDTYEYFGSQRCFGRRIPVRRQGADDRYRRDELYAAARKTEAALRRASMERSEEAAKERKRQMEAAYRKQAVEAAFVGYTMETGRFSYTVSPAASGSAIAAYEKNIMEAADTLQ